MPDLLHYVPLINTSFLIGCLAILAWLAIHSRRWTGAAQESRIRLLETMQERHGVRINTLETNFRADHLEIMSNMDELRSMLKMLATHASDMALMGPRLDHVERAVGDGLGLLDAINGAGCGHTECRVGRCRRVLRGDT